MIEGPVEKIAGSHD